MWTPCTGLHVYQVMDFATFLCAQDLLRHRSLGLRVSWLRADAALLSLLVWLDVQAHFPWQNGDIWWTYFEISFSAFRILALVQVAPKGQSESFLLVPSGAHLALSLEGA